MGIQLEPAATPPSLEPLNLSSEVSPTEAPSPKAEPKTKQQTEPEPLHLEFPDSLQMDNQDGPTAQIEIGSPTPPFAEHTPIGHSSSDGTTTIVRPAKRRARKTNSLILWEAPLLSRSKDPMAAAILEFLNQGVNSVLFLAIGAKSENSQIPKFHATATVQPESKLSYWKGLTWDPHLVQGLWHQFYTSGVSELSPPSDGTHIQSDRNVIRAALGCSQKETLTLVRVGAGAITAQVNEKAAEHHLQWPIRFAAEGSSQIGGNLATNAGGIHVLRYGNTRSWVSSIEIVLMSGEILELNNDLEKNNTGFDLRHLLIGSEGTLAIITAATLKLTRSPQALTTCLFAINQLKDALHILNDLKASPTLTPHAFEVFSSNSIDLIEQASSIRFPLKKESPYYLIVEYESHASDSLWESWLNQNWCQDGTVAQSTRDQRQIWIFRENISETLSSIGPVHKNDLAVPISQLPSFVQAIESLYQSEYPDLDVYLYGHLGDGNLHINVQKPTNQDLDLFLRQCEQSDLKIFALLQKFRGSVSAEHGIGLKKKNFLHFSRSPEEINLMRGIKSVFDPLGLLNPGKCF